MIRKALKILPWAGGILVCLILVLVVHIYLVTRPKAPDAHTRIMARMDIQQALTPEAGEQIQAWLYAQPGVDHVLVNPTSRIAVFTYSPLQADANDIISRCSQSLHYTTTRFVPSAEDMQKGCPAMAQSFTGSEGDVSQYTRCYSGESACIYTSRIAGNSGTVGKNF